ncbi:hypothetical protein LXL04_003088 [Taraxacum kok-saghyz]
MAKTERNDDAMPLEIETESPKVPNDLPNEKKTETVSNQDEDESAIQHDKGNLGNNDNSVTKDKKKRKKESTEEDPEPKKETKRKRRSKKETVSDKTYNLIRGKRFTPEEDEIVKESVLDYIKAHDLGPEGITKILNCSSYPEVKNCWKEIGSRLPNRPKTTIYYRAHILFEQDEKRKWTKEETEFLQQSYKKHGNNWKLVAEELGKHRIHVKDKWRRIKLDTKKSGRWTQEEYQGLYNLVNFNLQMKVVSEKKSKHGMLRDNIPWSAISEKLTTRDTATCCEKWYSQMTSSLVDEGKWSNADDYRLIRRLYDVDAACVEDVDWDGVLEHRAGDVCRKRWDQMVLHIGHHGKIRAPKKSYEASIKDWSKKSNLKTERVNYTADILVDSEFGTPGAITIANKHQNEFFLETITRGRSGKE